MFQLKKLYCRFYSHLYFHLYSRLYCRLYSHSACTPACTPTCTSACTPICTGDIKFGLRKRHGCNRREEGVLGGGGGLEQKAQS